MHCNGYYFHSYVVYTFLTLTVLPSLNRRRQYVSTLSTIICIYHETILQTYELAVYLYQNSCARATSGVVFLSRTTNLPLRMHGRADWD